MKNMKKKIHHSTMAILLALSVLSTMMISYAAVAPQYIGISRIEAKLEIDANDKATCSAYVTLSAPVYTSDVTMVLYRSGDGNKWTPLKTWTTNASSKLSWSKDYYVLSGYYYKVEVTAKVYNAASTLLESVTAASNVIYH